MNLQMQHIQAACLELKLPAMAIEWSAIADRCAGQNPAWQSFLNSCYNLNSTPECYAREKHCLS